MKQISVSNKGLAFVLLGSIFECGWAYGLKHSSTQVEYLFTICGVCVSFFSFMQAFKYLSASIAYALFVGFGTLFIVTADMITGYMNGENLHLLRLIFIFTLVVGVLGLKSIKE